nr:hypothetical protein [Candidatus Sigynarchaeum springense]
MNDFFIKVESSSKSGTVYRIYAKEVPNESEKTYVARGGLGENVNRDQTTRSPTKKHRKGDKTRVNGKKHVASANSWRINLIEPYIKEVMKRNVLLKGFQKTLDGNKIPPQPSNNGETVITEEDGVRLSILFRSVCRLQKMSRIDSILANVRTMNREEAYYWYSKIFPHRKSSKGMKAFRDLFG